MQNSAPLMLDHQSVFGLYQSTPMSAVSFWLPRQGADVIFERPLTHIFCEKLCCKDTRLPHIEGQSTLAKPIQLVELCTLWVPKQLCVASVTNDAFLIALKVNKSCHNGLERAFPAKFSRDGNKQP